MPRKRIIKDETPERIKKDPQLAASSRNFDKGEGVYQQGQFRKKFMEKNEDTEYETKRKSKVEKAAGQKINDGFDEKDYTRKESERPDNSGPQYGGARPYQARDTRGGAGYGNNDRSDRPVRRKYDDGTKRDEGSDSRGSRDGGSRPYQSRDTRGGAGYGSNDRGDRPVRRKYDDGPRRDEGRDSRGSRDGGSRPYQSRDTRGGAGYGSNDRGDRPVRRKYNDGPRRDEGHDARGSRDGGSRPYQSRDIGGRAGYGSNDRSDRPVRRKYDDGPRSDEGSDSRNSRTWSGGYKEEKFSNRRTERPNSSDRGNSGRGNDRPMHRDQLKPPMGVRKSHGTEGGFDKPEKTFSRDRSDYKGRSEGNTGTRSRGEGRDTEAPRYNRDDKYDNRKGNFDRDKKFGSDRNSNYGERSNRYEKKPFRSTKGKAAERQTNKTDGPIRLNKYISNAGICSRREADEYITAGLITVNGEVITELGSKVNPGDKVKYNGAAVRSEVLRYVLLNKPKDYLCTMDDPQERRTVMELVRSACRERIYPVGRLDRNTTGLLLLTNDGLLADKLMHPRTEIKKIYQVELDKNLRAEHLEQLRKGIDLEDGFIKPDEIGFDEGSGSRRIIGIALHSGRNRIVRRMMEHFGYQVVKLDRTYYAGLTKKDLPRGKCRMLTEMELNMLKMVSGKN
ncbi:MAG: RNA-binding S4 domain-containing protein [Bacteroidetes bacterium]|nr:RNA-binding S4 domain-containing protein [Bacteroidota bacterium]